MRRRPLTVLTILTLATATAATGQSPATQPTANNPAPSTTQATMEPHLRDASYGIGYNMGRQLSQAPFKLDIDRIVDGLRDSNGGKPPAVSEAQLQAAMERLQADASATAAAQGGANGTAGDAYREANAKKPGVTTTPSGLQIETITEGTGASPKASDTVTVHYTGTLIDGTKFDSSVDRGEPVSFPLGGVIKGWTEGLQLMKTGGKARLVIPPAIAYGPNGSGPIPPNATLVFDVELLGIEKQ